MSRRLRPSKMTERASWIKLVPQPLPTPLDPLNWSWQRKFSVLGTLALASFASDGAPSANFLAYNRQALTYQKEPTQIAYGLSAALAGYWAGPWVYPILFQAFGKSAVVFWGLLLQILTEVWAACMTQRDDYIGYVISRFCSGTLATIPFAAGSSVIMEMYFLHQRGRMFALLELSYVFGIFVVPTIGGYIIQTQSQGWSWCFWWAALLIGAVEIFVLLFVEETKFNRELDQQDIVQSKSSFLQKRIDLFFHLRGQSIQSLVQTWRELLLSPLLIITAPHVIAAGSFNMVCFAFANVAATLVNIFLQAPIAKGGYDFSPGQNATFSFTSWVAIGFGFVYGCVSGDAIPIAFSRRRGGRWSPEYRLLNLILPGLLLPIGLGITGASLKYHHHYVVLALGLFLTQFSAQIGIPVCINYIAETFVGRPVSVIVAMNGLRHPLSIAIPFTFQPWLQATGPGWIFGTAALISLGMFILVMVVCFSFGKRSRNLKHLRKLCQAEDDTVIFTEKLSPQLLEVAGVKKQDTPLPEHDLDVESQTKQSHQSSQATFTNKHINESTLCDPDDIKISSQTSNEFR